MGRLSPRSGLEGLETVVVDDEDDIRLGLAKLVGSLGGRVRSASNGAEALELLSEHSADVVLTDLMMPRVSGQELLHALRETHPHTRVVILTGFGTIQSAVTCLQAGAAHFMTKPFDNAEVLRVVERLGRQILAQRVALERPSQSGFVAEDPAMQAVMELVARVAKSPLPVLIEGESGTGKELVARALHDQSTLCERPFLAVNTAALPDTLLESELFGHKRGAFTGAERDHDGLFAQASGGTVFLDEIASMSPSFQGKLLRVLQEKRVRPLGGTQDRLVDFRLIAATNRDLEERIRRGEFREDLFYRLSVVRLHLPALRDRPGDIRPLAQHFLARSAEACLNPNGTELELGEETIAALEAHTWSGNVRELENAIQRAVIVCPGARILPHHLGLAAGGWKSAVAVETDDYDAAKQQAIARFQREFVLRALETAGGNVSQAAERCGLTRAALQRIMRALEIDRSAFQA